MKTGIRRPSIKKSFSARTTGKAKRKLKRIANPFYGKKGMGWVKNPKKALYNKVYNKTTVSSKKAMGCITACIYYPMYWMFAFIFWFYKWIFIGMWWLIVQFVNLIIGITESIINRGRSENADLEEHTNSSSI